MNREQVTYLREYGFIADPEWRKFLRRGAAP